MKDGATERVDEPTIATAPEINEYDKAKREGKRNNKEYRTENLRKKLCEILGTTSSPRVFRAKERETRPLKICSPENDGGDKLCRETSKTGIRPNDGKTFSLGNEMGRFQGCLSDHQKECPQTVLLSQEKEFCQSPKINKTDYHGEREGLANRKQEEDKNIPVLEYVSDLQDNFQSPSFRLKKPTLSSLTPSSKPETDEMVNVVSSPASSERRFSVGAMPNLRTFQIMEPGYGRSRA
ncbi:hypothetical protein L6164_010369 [Bauhinia variegata]|uniref:Uncharacterized protein n=1 Tax=Bauhinia variegata TaxID=167791 RepID=A0ACB9PN05_BAUVA|nr:hypothetical protein L6164_010369 [Bauhinia variegata]